MLASHTTCLYFSFFNLSQGEEEEAEEQVMLKDRVSPKYTSKDNRLYPLLNPTVSSSHMLLIIDLWFRFSLVYQPE